jgi:pimeloyl-ACP methyl ester carboxylesterase
LAVFEAGEGKPIVLLHGLTATHRYVVMGSRALERSGHRLIGYDARGHGSSAPPDERHDYGYESLTADLVRVLNAAGVDRAVFAGVSMGCHTVLRLALERPERVAGIVAITPGHDPSAPRGPAELADWDALADALRRGGVDGFIGSYDKDRVADPWRESIETVLRQRLELHEHLDAVADALETVPRSSPFESLDELASIAAPTVVVASGDEADPGHPHALALAYARAIPGAEVATEEPGKSPLAWQGSQLSKVIAGVAARAEGI